MREHQKNRAGYEVESVLCETCLDALDENQDACEPQQIEAQKTAYGSSEKLWINLAAFYPKLRHL